MLDIIFRSCSRSESQVHNMERIFSKPECTFYCLKSIVESSKQLEVPYKIIVIDDHSHSEIIDKMKSLLITDRDDFISIENTGNGESLKACYKYADENCNDIIYFVEDDYLHELNALILMLDAYYTFKSYLPNKEIALFPIDCNDRYKLDRLEPCYILPGKDRYWRTVTCTTGTFLLHKNIFIKFRNLFDDFTLYPATCEANTINKIWTNEQGAMCFSPMPTLTYHLQLEEFSPFYSDWKKCLNKLIGEI